MKLSTPEMTRLAGLLKGIVQKLRLTPRNHPTPPVFFQAQTRALVSAMLTGVDAQSRDAYRSLQAPPTLERIKKSSPLTRIGEQVEFPKYEPVRLLEYGATKYPLRQPATELFRDGEYSLEGLSEYIVGRGETFEKAKKAFLHEFHEQFQLFRKQSKEPLLERSNEKQRFWNALESVIDIRAYDDLAVIVYPHDVGEIIASTKHGSRRVKWNGDSDEEIAVERAPAHFAAFSVGTWFEAVVERRNSTGELLKIDRAVVISKPPLFSEEERNDFWNQTQSKENANRC